MKENLRILHINDLHSHFEAYPKIKRFFDERSKTAKEVLRLDIGDNVDKSHPLTDSTAGRINVDLMNALGINFATIGNNEGIGLAKDEINQLYDEADFQVILGNLRDKKGRPAWAQPYIIYETTAGTKLALLAYTFPYYLTYKPNGWQVLDAVASLKKDLEKPEVQAADFRILLSHLGVRIDEKIAHEIPEIDLIIGAHTHHVFEEGEVINGTYLAAAGRYGDHVGQIDLAFEDHRLTDITIEAISTSDLDYEKGDRDFAVDLFEQGERLLAADVICKLSRKPTLEECAEMVMEAMVQSAGADLTIINTGLIVEPFSSTVTKATLHKSLPHQMRLVTLQVNKEELLEICQDIFAQADLLANQQIRGMGFRGKQFGRVVTSGFTYKNGKIVYNNKVTSKKDKLSLVLVDQYYFAPYFSSINSRQGQLLFPDLLRQTVEKYLRGDL
ncbi:bifunctional metallophosphatase/5'-nucleotidase [Streptococcus ratti]|uniref:Bifunctional metallophosphatase/5'-nucleotidase n=1 Tax=Streptococcus ratti TaxID=1341 RepID=A0A7X9QHN7_STRRT|nr:metallophosphatase [Streptococcus ratti]NMD49375.1 bifunctional metallophosphatase/5'-nucleotidase [Streptococcus ratti]